MVRAVAREPCPECGAQIQVDMTQRCNDQLGLEWSKEYRCPVCGLQRSEQGQGEPPADVVKAVLWISGFWYLYIEENDQRTTQAVIHLRVTFGLSLVEAGNMRRRIRQTGIADIGTRPEIERLQTILSQAGYACSMRGHGFI